MLSPPNVLEGVGDWRLRRYDVIGLKNYSSIPCVYTTINLRARLMGYRKLGPLESFRG